MTLMSMQSKLDWLIGNVSLQSDITQMVAHMGVMNTDIQNLKENAATKTEVSDLASPIAKMELEVKNMKENDMKMDFGPEAASSSIIPEAMIKRLETLEKELSEKTTGRDLTMVVGGLKDHSTLDEAEQFIRNKLWTHYGPAVTEVYAKGDFKGLVFVKFSSKVNRDSATSIFRQQKFKHGENLIWAKEDMPISARLKQSVLFSAKKAMISWGYDKTAIWADTESSKLNWRKYHSYCNND